MGRTVLVLGAGLGGLVAAETLRKLLPGSDRVIAVDRAERHFFPPSLLWLMVGERTPEDFTRSLDRLVGRGVEFRHGAVTRIDPLRREVDVAGEVLAADALVIALGAEYAPETIPVSPKPASMPTPWPARPPSATPLPVSPGAASSF